MIDNYLSIHLSLGAILIKSAISYHADNLGRGPFFPSLLLSHADTGEMFVFNWRDFLFIPFSICIYLYLVPRRKTT